MVNLQGVTSYISKVGIEKGTFICLVLCLFITKISILFTYGFEFTGSDDQTFWLCAYDYAQGIFWEPFFYGQNYNFPLESLLAVPLIWLNVPLQYALPIVSCLIGMLPFLISSLVLFQRKEYLGAYTFLLILICLPVEYDIITTFTRGFTSGILMCSALIFPILHPRKISSFVILGFFGALAYVLNPNAILYVFPVAFYLFLVNYKQILFYLFTGVSALPAFTVSYLAKQFYVDHPENVVHSMWDLTFDWELFAKGFEGLDKFYKFLMPIIWDGHWIVLVLVLFLAIRLFWIDGKKGWSMVLTVLGSLIMMGINKVNDDIGTIFLSSNRMYLAIPLLLALALYWNFSDKKIGRTVYTIILSVAFTFTIVKVSIGDTVTKVHTHKENHGPVAIKKVKDHLLDCDTLAYLSELHHPDLLVLLGNWEHNVPSLEFYGYGCTALGELNTSTILQFYERRTWVYQKEINAVRNTVLFVNFDMNKLADCDLSLDYEVLDHHQDLLLVKNNTYTLTELADILGIEITRN